MGLVIGHNLVEPLRRLGAVKRVEGLILDSDRLNQRTVEVADDRLQNHYDPRTSPIAPRIRFAQLPSRKTSDDSTVKV